MIYGPYTARQTQSVPPEYTYSTPEATEPPRKRVFDWYAVAYADRVAFFLRANRYTSARKDLCVGAFSVDSMFIEVDRLQDLFAEVLSRRSRAPIGR